VNVNDQLSQHTQTGVIPAVVGQLSATEFMKFIDETRAQPAFRITMDKCADYYDGNQLTSEVLQDLDNMGFSSLMTNLIKPAIDTVLGIEAKSRTDFRMVSDDDAHQDVAEALSAKLKEVERETRADRACSDAYAGMVKAGLGWVHTTRNQDPFAYPIRVENVHRREMFWDWASKDPGLNDARYVIRQKWFPVDQVTAALPSHAPLINASASGWQPDWMQRARESTTLMAAIDQESRMSVSAWEWRNIDSRRVALQEVWYATHIRGLVLNLGDRTVEFDRNNPLHMAAIASGVVKPEPSVYRKLRCSMWFGPHLLQDLDPGGLRLPYTPFWGFREDLTGTPYGLIRNMIPLQDEVNARRRKLMWLLSSKRVQIDSDALDARYNSIDDVIDEISRPDSMMVTNPARQNINNAIHVESDLSLSAQQFEILNEAKEGIQSAAGIFNSMMGKSDGAKSGIAINGLIEQGSNTMGELNDNFKFSRQLVGENLIELIRADMKGKQVKVMAGPNEAKRKVIMLNVPKIDELTGVQYLENDTDKARVKVALEDVPSTPAYRAQQHMMLSEVLKSLPPQLQAPLIPFLVDSTDLPKRHEMADLLRKSLGQQTENGEPQDPQVAQLQQQLQVLHQQSQQAMSQYEQAVQEQSSKAQELQQQVSSLQMQVKDKAGELQVRQAEVELKRQEMALGAQRDQQAHAAKLQAEQFASAERMKALEVKTGEQQLQTAQLGLKSRELDLQAAKHASDHFHKSTELETAQLQAASDVPEPDNEIDPATKFSQERELLEIKVAAEKDKAVTVAKIAAEAQVKVAEMRASPTPGTLTPEQEEAADDDDEPGKPDADAKPAAKPAAPKPRRVQFTYGKDGKLAGAHIGGRPIAKIERDPVTGAMKHADLLH
jgi:hypothetical protein